jgi:hypothetical protein
MIRNMCLLRYHVLDQMQVARAALALIEGPYGRADPATCAIAARVLGTCGVALGGLPAAAMQTLTNVAKQGPDSAR